MATIKKVGIYLDTKGGNSAGGSKFPENGDDSQKKRGRPYTDLSGYRTILVIATSDGTSYFPLDVDVFLNGWFSPSRRGEYHSPYRRIDGAIDALARDAGGYLDTDVQQALREFCITPTFLRNYSKTNSHRIKWAQRKRGGQGGDRRSEAFLAKSGYSI